MARRALEQNAEPLRQSLTELESLLDAIHNLPKFAMQDDENFRSWAYDRMREFDQRSGTSFLTNIYDQARS